jgi:hypothetical protein
MQLLMNKKRRFSESEYIVRIFSSLDSEIESHKDFSRAKPLWCDVSTPAYRWTQPTFVRRPYPTLSIFAPLSSFFFFPKFFKICPILLLVSERQFGIP